MKRILLSITVLVLALLGLSVSTYFLSSVRRNNGCDDSPTGLCGDHLGNSTPIVQVIPIPICSTWELGSTTVTLSNNSQSVPFTFHACQGDAGQRFKFTIVATEIIGPHPGQTVTRTLYATVRGRCTFNTADTGTDWKVDLDDISRVGFAFGKPVFDSVADVNGDGRVDILDMACVAFYYGQSQAPF